MPPFFTITPCKNLVIDLRLLEKEAAMRITKSTYVPYIALDGLAKKLPRRDDHGTQDHQAGGDLAKYRESKAVNFQRPARVFAEDFQVSEQVH